MRIKVMKKFKVDIPCNYIVGYLRQAHVEAIIKAETIEEARLIAKNYNDYELVIDEYEVEDYDEYDFENMKIMEIK